MRLTLPKPLVLLTFFLVIAFACQDEPTETPVEDIDQDMVLATLLADDYLGSLGGRAESAKKAITVFKYEDGVMVYNTNTDDINGYQRVYETTVTAFIEPGEYVFFFAGAGVSDLEDIDFDDTSENYLETLPEEVNADQMWVIQAPIDAVPGTELKYDIVYQYQEQGVESDIIRLDPKIVYDQTSVSDEDSNSSDSGQD